MTTGSRCLVLFAATCCGATASAQGLDSASSAVSTPVLGSTFRSIDGTSNNLTHPRWGAANVPLLRRSAAGYADGLTSPGGATRPSPRAVSNALCAQSGSFPNAEGASDFVWQWGQFVDHDLDLTGGASPAEPFDIQIPLGDPFFDPFSTGTETMALSRSKYRIDAVGMRQQMNEITAYIDASMVYGSDVPRALELRALDGTGRLEVSAGDLMPFNLNAFPNAPTEFDPSMFLAGDVRSNEQNGLTALHTLFVREHNTWADLFGILLPLSDDETRYQLARTIVWAEVQAITYNEWLPVLIGPNALPPYTGYRPATNPGVANEFSSAAFRVGHTLLSPTLLRRDALGNPIAAGDLPLQSAFFNPGAIVTHGIEPLLRGLAMQPAQEVDPLIVDDVRNFLFGPPGAGGFDLASLNLQRGRDHGLADYNAMRRGYRLPLVTDFDEITSDPALALALENTYGSVDDIDSWVGGLAEDHVTGALVGPLIQRVLIDQFTRVRDGDRFWYQLHLDPSFVSLVEAQTLAVIIRRNTSIGSELQDDVFHALVP